MISATSAPLQVQQGNCHVLYVYDIGFAIDLDECDRRITLDKHRHTLAGKRRAPRHFDIDPPPLVVSLSAPQFTVVDYTTSGQLEMFLYDFGALTVRYLIPIEGPFAGLRRLSDELYDHEELEAFARQCVKQLLAVIRPAVSKPSIAESVEDYAIYEIQQMHPATPLDELCRTHGREMAQILRADDGLLSDQEIADALQCRLSFGSEDTSIIDWNAALLFDRDPDEVRSVLEFANVELLELRYLDERLDHALEQAYEVLIKPRSVLRLPGTAGPDLNRVAMLQVDSVMLFEGVNNALKLLSDHYLARVYRLAAQRFHLNEWDESILRKINTLESIYEKLSNQSANVRLEVLEWIIIVLIAVSIVLSLMGL